MPFIPPFEIAFGSLAILMLALVLAWMIHSSCGFYKNAITQESASARYHSIDGLRGYLATGVMLHHILINHHFYLTGKWELTSSPLTTFLGRGSVAMFFMVTAFLFWGRMIESRGQFNIKRFFGNRFRRLVPMYLVSASLVIVTALALTRFQLNVPLPDLVGQIGAWLLFTIPGSPDINGYGSTNLINTVFWSLVAEWKFYLLLPIIGKIAFRWGVWPIVSGICLIAFFGSISIQWYFVAGCVAAVVVRIPAIQTRCGSPLAAVLGCVCAMAAMIWQPMIYTLGGAMLLFVTFTIIAGGNTFFGLLTNKAAGLLGLLSYSIYLLHNWVLFLVARLIDRFYAPILEISHTAYLMLGAGVAGITILLAALTYRFIEFPPLRRTPVSRGA